MSGAFWGAADDAESIRVIHQALDLGVTSSTRLRPCRGGGRETLAGRRQQAVIATKAAPNQLEPAETVIGLDESLKRRQTIMSTSISSIGRTQMCRSAQRWTRSSDCARGPCPALGVSNFGAKELGAARKYRLIDVLQPPYNTQWREVEAATLPYCRKHNIGVMPYSGLAQGLHTGALSQTTAFVEGDERRTTVLFQPGTCERALDAVEGLRPIAAKYSKSVAQLAVQWLTSRPGVSAPLLGARTVHEMKENAASVAWSIAAADVAEINRLILPVWKEIVDKGDMSGYRAKQREAKAKA
jgi:myo-inositol catabolism protein IolS